MGDIVHDADAVHILGGFKERIAQSAKFFRSHWEAARRLAELGGTAPDMAYVPRRRAKAK